MDISIFLARALGLYFVIVSIAVLVHRSNFTKFLKTLIQNRELMFVLGFNILIIGVLLVVSHNYWVANWTVVITIVAWLILIKGIINLVFPDLAVKMAKSVLQWRSGDLFSAGINLLLGIYFLYFGYLAYYGTGF